jgi:tetratricopeptide (TPR) repeat protein
LLGLAYIYHHKGHYSKAEEYYNKAINLKSDELKIDPYYESIILLNRGRNKLDKEDFSDALIDLTKAMKEPDLAADSNVNLGLVFLKQGLYGKAESHLYRAIDLTPNIPHAYYNLGVLYNEEGNKDRAKKLFKAALSIDKDFSEARDALTILEGSGISSIGGDWVNWWFPSIRRTRWAKIKISVAIAIMTAIVIFTIKAAYNVLIDKEIPASLYGILAVLVLFLVLPIISKLKLGPVELEVESKGEHPQIINTYAISIAGVREARPMSGIAGLLFFEIIFY